MTRTVLIEYEEVKDAADVFLFGFYCRRLAPNYFLRIPCPPYVSPVIIWQKQKFKPGLPAVSAQTWSSLSRAFFPLPLHRSWAGTEHFQLVLSFLKCLLLFILPLIFFFF